MLDKNPAVMSDESLYIIIDLVANQDNSAGFKDSNPEFEKWVSSPWKCSIMLLLLNKNESARQK